MRLIARKKVPISLSLTVLECQWISMAGSNGYRADSPISTSIDDYSDYDYNKHDDPRRRISNITATSVSSFPDSAWPSDSDVPAYYSNAKYRPAYRIGSRRRSPLPERISPSSLRPPKHSSHRPRSRDESGRPRSRGEDVAHHEGLQETPAPLVLLHVTILPPRLPWSRAVLDATLNPELKRQFGVLRAATSGLVAQRGILIAHPGDEFELVEENVLEALDLLPERIGYDGQYRPRTPNTRMGDEVDDGEEILTPICETCQRVHVGDAWYTRVYAANGLMRARAWGACWSEMERVDVEVRPCISEHIRQRLDEMQLAEDAVNERGTRHLPVQPLPKGQLIQKLEHQIKPHLVASTQKTTMATLEPQHTLEVQSRPTESRPLPMLSNDLPPIYQPKDVPLRLLLRNYLYLVLRNRRNVAIFFLALALLASIIYGMLAPQGSLTGTSFVSQVAMFDEPTTCEVVLPRNDAGHGKRHPIWKQDTFEPKGGVAFNEYPSSSEVVDSDQHTERILKTIAAEPTPQMTTAGTTSTAAAKGTSTASIVSSNPAFLPSLHGSAQCLPEDPRFSI
jgi:hypothetical protein